MEKEKQLVYKEEECIHFKDGLFGFEQYKKYVPFPVQEDSDVMLYLQSVENLNLSFVLMNPFYLDPDYAPKLSEHDMQSIGAEKEDIISYYVICVMKERPTDCTVNLKCPIIVNSVTREAKQVILEEGEYQFRHRLSEFSRKEG